MIKIRKLRPIQGADKNGWHRYEAKIHPNLLAEFIHRRSDGLALCLRRAANAVSKKENE